MQGGFISLSTSNKDHIAGALEIRRAVAADFESLALLQNANLASNLPAGERQSGFLSVGFSAEQFACMSEDLAVVVAVLDGDVKAFLCASTVEFNQAVALPAAMIARFPRAKYHGQPLSTLTLCIVGPVCIDQSLRGQGVLSRLYDYFFAIAPQEFDIAVVFVSADNLASIKAHEKLGLETIDEFESNSTRYFIMARRFRLAEEGG